MTNALESLIADIHTHIEDTRDLCRGAMKCIASVEEWNERLEKIAALADQTRAESLILINQENADGVPRHPPVRCDDMTLDGAPWRFARSRSISGNLMA